MRAVFFSSLGHEAHIADVAHGGHAISAQGAAIVDDGLIDTGIAAVGDHRDHVMRFAIGTPHAARGTDGRRHRGVDDDVAGHMQVGDALVRVDHGQRRTRGIGGLYVGQHFGALRLGQCLDAHQRIADAVVGVDAQLRQHVRVLGKHVIKINADCMAEHDRVRDLHHGGLQV